MEIGFFVCGDRNPFQRKKGKDSWQICSPNRFSTHFFYLYFHRVNCPWTFFRLSFRFGAKFITLFKVKATLNRFRLIRREIAAKVALPAGVSTKPQNGSDKNKGILSILEKIFIFMASFFCESRFHLIALSVWLLVFSLTGKLSQWNVDFFPPPTGARVNQSSFYPRDWPDFLRCHHQKMSLFEDLLWLVHGE